MVKKNFNFSEDEIWVLTKLRMILYKLGAEIKHFNLKSTSRQKGKKYRQKNSSSSQNNHDDDKEKPKSKKKRLTKEEKQLAELRSIRYEKESELNEVNNPLLHSSKQQFLNLFGLRPVLINI